jgi:multiple sugar transport system permease protein
MSLIMLGLVYYPIALTFIYSLRYMVLTKPLEQRFIGLSNYRTILQDPAIGRAFFNSFYVLILVITLTLIIGLLFALLLHKDTRIKGILTAIAIIPWALPPIVNGVMWRWVFHPSYGIINKLITLGNPETEQIMWLTDKWLVLTIVALVNSWRSIPLACVIFLATLQNIPAHLYEAATIDGCSISAKFWRITLPLIKPAMGIILTTTSITAINIFDEIVAISGYGNATKTVMVETYMRSFRFLNFGEGSALIYIAMAATSIIGIFYVKRVYKEVEYL